MMMVLWLDGGGMEKRTTIHQKGRSINCVGQKRGLQLSQAQPPSAMAGEDWNKEVAAAARLQAPSAATKAARWFGQEERKGRKKKKKDVEC